MAEEQADRALQTYQNVSGFNPEDIAILARISAQVEPILSQLTDRFYQNLLLDPATATGLEGRVEALKATHLVWLKELFAGQSIEALVQRQEMIGKVHVRAKIPPVFVAASMSFLRGAFPEQLSTVIADKADVVTAASAVLRTLDICQYLIDRAYNQCLMDNLGIKPALLNRLMTA
jgi:truncated hemoglobin YjbI